MELRRTHTVGTSPEPTVRAGLDDRRTGPGGGRHEVVNGVVGWVDDDELDLDLDRSRAALRPGRRDRSCRRRRRREWADRHGVGLRAGGRSAEGRSPRWPRGRSTGRALPDAARHHRQSGKSATIAWTIEQVQKPTLVLRPNKSLAAQLAQEFREFFPDNRVEYFVSTTTTTSPRRTSPRATPTSRRTRRSTTRSTGCATRPPRRCSPGAT
jgi:hypothetical protein